MIWHTTIVATFCIIVSAMIKNQSPPPWPCYVDEDCVYPVFGCIIGLGDVPHLPPMELKRDQQQGYTSFSLINDFELTFA